jgi:hypothetical protein
VCILFSREVLCEGGRKDVSSEAPPIVVFVKR